MALLLVRVFSFAENVTRDVEIIDKIRDDVQIQISDVFRDIVNN